MKKALQQAVTCTFILLSIFFSSCEEDSNILSYKMTADIGGQEFKSATPVATIQQDKLIIEATSLSGQSLLLTINGKDAGSYKISASPSLIQFSGIYKETIQSSSDDAFLASGGEIILTEVDTENKRLSGTFNFTVRRNLTESITISNGNLNNIKILSIQ